MYHWFMPKGGGRIINPMCGEATSGFVAAQMGFRFVGVDVREEQVNHNNKVVKDFGLDHLAKFIHRDSRYLTLEDVDNEKFDLVFFSPPYYGVEKYSNEPDDISTYENYNQFMTALYQIIESAAKLLKENRFYIINVGDVREIHGPDKGKLLNFCGDIVNFAESIGLRYYNDIILSQNLGTSGYRARNLFRTRKLVRIHQRVLVFFKGDFDTIKEEFPQDFTAEQIEDLMLKVGIDTIPDEELPEEEFTEEDEE
jgi:DNA modification methylase